MNTPVRFRSAVKAMAFDGEHRRFVSSIVAVDTKGRLWESYAADGSDRPPTAFTMLPAPSEPRVVQLAKRRASSSKK